MSPRRGIFEEPVDFRSAHPTDDDDDFTREMVVRLKHLRWSQVMEGVWDQNPLKKSGDVPVYTSRMVRSALHSGDLAGGCYV